MAGVEVSKPSRRLSPKGSFKLSLPSLLACGQCKATAVSPPESPTGVGARSFSSSASSSAGTSRGRERDRLAELREIFGHFDRDMDGRISGDELREFFASMGDDSGAAAAAAAAMGLDGAAGGGESGGGGGGLMLAFEDFVRIVERKGGEEEEREDPAARVRGVRGGEGRVLSQLGDEASVAECEAMISAYDDDGDGELDFHDFHRMMSQD
ncbi:hypothetical protein OsJ_03573 [Oryza sativa Japonica Group]|uniref:EF-hand domain-containing protein n=1 Tax=Oryza sativa subsp. japonica TaxID=39947 RepID=A2ZY59_ORYSJ|nr:hypothetical protein OsJ_03573 [Oryza sativa Japonica Group]